MEAPDSELSTIRIDSREEMIGHRSVISTVLPRFHQGGVMNFFSLQSSLSFPSSCPEDQRCPCPSAIESCRILVADRMSHAFHDHHELARIRGCRRVPLALVFILNSGSRVSANARERPQFVVPSFEHPSRVHFRPASGIMRYL